MAPIPGVATYGQAALAAKTAYQKALARLNERRTGALRQYGFQGDIDPETGVVKNVHTDGLNPYGEFQLLNRAQAQRDEAAQWSGIERGLGAGGGLAAQLRNRERFAFGAEDAQLGQNLIGSLSGYQDEQNMAAYGRDSALYQAELDAARLAIQNADYGQADYSGLEYPVYGDTTAPYQTFAPAGMPKPAPVRRAFVPGVGAPKIPAKPVRPAKPILPTKRVVVPGVGAPTIKKKGKK